MNDEKLGYLIAKVEELALDVKEMRGKYDALEKRVEDKFRTAEITLRILKFIGLAVAAVLTFKFGDLPSLWFKLFG